MNRLNMDKFAVDITPNWEGLVRSTQRNGAQNRVYFVELLWDQEVQHTICERYGLTQDLDSDDPYFELKRLVKLQRFLGYDYVRCSLDDFKMPLNWDTVNDTASLQRNEGRNFINQHKGPITTWEEFETYPWPDPQRCSTRSLEWYEKHLPDDMCVVGSGGFAHFAEYLTWLMGYETLCFTLYDQRDLVTAISQKLFDIYTTFVSLLLQFDRVKIIFGSDDMGFRSGTLISPKDLREFVLPGHKMMAQISHEAGRPYWLHSCGNLKDIMEDLIDNVAIDAKHSFEDTIETPIEAKDRYGDRIAILGGIDIDFLCRANEEQIRQRVRNTLEHCLPGGGYCLGTGNSVTNYLPLGNYLIMLDEGRKFKP
jgi:uroporphyrinogen decarboxylase